MVQDTWQTSDQDRLNREARDWVARERLDTLSADERAAAKAWRSRSTEHEAAYQSALRLWALAGEASREFDTASRPTVTRRGVLMGGGLAAGGAGAAYAAGVLGLLPTWTAIRADHATGRGEQNTFELSDGLTIELDGESALDVDPGGRTLRLTRGAAVVSVAPNGDPTDRDAVSVLAGAGRSVAKAAVFSLRHAADTIDVSCIDGTVDVVHDRRASLVSGQSIRYADTGMSRPIRTEIADIAAWRRGYLIFRNQDLRDVVADLNRPRPGLIILTDDDIKLRKISGTFNLGALDEIIPQLATAFDLEATSLPGGIVLLS